MSEATLPVWFATLAGVHRPIMAYEGARSYAYEYDARPSALSSQLLEPIGKGLASDPTASAGRASGRPGRNRATECATVALVRAQGQRWKSGRFWHFTESTRIASTILP